MTGEAYVYIPKSATQIADEEKDKQEKRRFKVAAFTVDTNPSPNKILEQGQDKSSTYNSRQSVLKNELPNLDRKLSLVRISSLGQNLKNTEEVSKKPTLSPLRPSPSSIKSASNQKFSFGKEEVGTPLFKKMKDRNLRDFAGKKDLLPGIEIPTSTAKKPVLFKLNLEDQRLKQYVEEEMNPDSPRLHSFLINTPADMITFEEVLLVTNRRNRALYLRDNLIALKKVLTLKPENFFGERALFNNMTRAATIVASKDCFVITLRKDPFKHFFDIQQQRTQVKMDVIAQAFSTLWPSELKKLIIGFSEVVLARGNHAFYQGDKTDGFYVIKEGEIKVFSHICSSIIPFSWSKVSNLL